MKILMISSYSLPSIFIKIFTFSKWNHTAILFDDGTVFDSVFTGGGVRKMSYDEFKKHYKNIEELELGVADISGDGRRFAEAQVGKKYDWTAIFGIVFQNRHWEKPDRWFCSELVEATILAIGKRRFRVEVSTLLPRDVRMVA